eukprot:scaffold5458_cov131-Isochrysis_galbana.AAC.9
MARAVASSSSVAPSQFMRSTSPSKELALPCTPFELMLGAAAKPRLCQSRMMRDRIDEAFARLGSVEPSTSERNSAQDVRPASHSTEK